MLQLGCTRDGSAGARAAQAAPHAALAFLAAQRRFPAPRGWASLPPGIEAALGAPGGALLDAAAAQEARGAPFSAPLFAHLATPPDLGPSLARMLARLRAADAAVGARFGAEASGAGGGAHTDSGAGCASFSDAEDALAGLVDEYSTGS